MPYFLTPGRQSGRRDITRQPLLSTLRRGVVTPPLDDNLLPGVTRREVLDLFEHATFRSRSSSSPPLTLRRSVAAFWTSSLSGAVPVAAVDGHSAAGTTGCGRHAQCGAGNRLVARDEEVVGPASFGLVGRETAAAPPRHGR